MRNAIIGIVIGCVIGVMIGATVIAPRLDEAKQALTGRNAMGQLKRPDISTLPERDNAGISPESISESSTQENTVSKWRMISEFPESLPQLGTMATRIAQKVWEISGGELEITTFGPGKLVSDKEILNAVSSGAVEAAFSTPDAWADKAPALQLFSAIPFGPEPGEFLAWYTYGGGKAFFEELLDENGMYGMPCGMIAPEASGWFRDPITSPGEMTGLRMHATGLGAQVLEKLGVHVENKQGGDLFMALESGSLDGVEFSMPAIDLKLGFHKLARHYYFPGWHQPTGVFNLIIHKPSWDSLSKRRKAQIESVCGDNIRFGLAEGEALQYSALKEITKLGVKIHQWPTPFLTTFKSTWLELASEISESDDTFRRVWDSLRTFRRNYAIWSEIARP